MVLAGGTAGAVGAVIANPADVIKVQMQADKSGKLYKNLFDVRPFTICLYFSYLITDVVSMLSFQKQSVY
jgi:hypothetical protein